MRSVYYFVRAGIIVLIFFSQDIFAQQFVAHTYPADDSNFANPERGFYHHTETNSSSFSPLNESTLQNYRQSSITLILRLFYLESFVNSPISQAQLVLMQHDFATARRAGVKIVLRFAYTKNQAKPFGDATPDRVVQHVQQLAPLLRDNADVIAVVQAGFVGAWGEWYYTDYFSQVPGLVTAANWADRTRVINAYLAALPATRMIQVRTPQIKFNLTGSSVALTDANAFSGSATARIAHHNDCFLANDTDYGTYQDIEVEKNFLEQDTKFLAMGGETCNVDIPLSECPNAVAQMKRFHWSFLNRDYHEDVLSSWTAGGCMDDAQRQLGYRYRLTKTNLQQDAKPGSRVQFDFAVVNDGWANVFNERAVEVVLKNSLSGKIYRLKANSDPRRWTMGDTTKISIVAGLPAAIEQGSYSVHLNLPDPQLSLKSNPLYSIRFANTNIWDASTGFNDLGHVLTIASSSTAPAYTGSDFFLSDEVTIGLSTPGPLLSTTYGKNVILYWGLQANGPTRIIERSENGGSYETIATLDGKTFTYRDAALSGSSYSYKSHSSNGSQISPSTDALAVTLSASAPSYYVFKADGDAREWEAVSPIGAVAAGGTTNTLRLFTSADTLYALSEGKNHLTNFVLLNTDNSTSTGIQSGLWSSSGFDYKISNDSLYRASGSSWAFASIIKNTAAENYNEQAVALTSLQNPNTLINAAVIGKFTTGESFQIPLTGETLMQYFRPPVPDAMTLFAVNKSTKAPESELLVTWKACNSCNGYAIERSIGTPDNFQNVATIAKSVYFYADKALTAGTKYYYRAAAYNEVGLSSYTPVVSATPGADVVTGLESPTAGGFYPNPVGDHFIIPATDASVVSLIDLLGRSVEIGTPEATPEGRRYTASNLSTGLYFIKMRSSAGTRILRLLKL